MTITSSATRVIYQGDGASTAFTVPFPFWGSAELEVSRLSAASDILPLAVGVHYVVGGGSGAAGTVTLFAPPAITDQIMIRRLTNRTQLADFVANDDLSSDVLERVVDRLATVVQEDYEIAGRALHAPTNEPPLRALPPAARRAGGILTFDSTGQPFVAPRILADTTVPTVAYVPNYRLPDDVDWTAAVQRAAATGQPVQLPPFDIVISDCINVTTPGQQIRGYGRFISRVIIQSTFNLSALAAFALQANVTSYGGGAGPELIDFGIYYQVAETADFGSLIAFPPAIYVNSTARVYIRNLRIQIGYDGIVLSGDCGGLDVDGLETSCLRNNIYMDGEYDTIRLHRWHCWPFGLADGSHTLLASLFFSATCFGLHAGRVDDLHMTNCLFLNGVNSAVNLFLSSRGESFGTITDCDFDTNGGLVIAAGDFTMLGGSITLGDGKSAAVIVNGGDVALVGVYMLQGAGTTSGCMVQLNNGTLRMNACKMRSVIDQSNIIINNGEAVIVANTFFDDPPTAVRTAARIFVAGGGGTISSNWFEDSSQTPPAAAIAFDADNTYTVAVNTFGLRHITQASTAPLQNVTFIGNTRTTPESNYGVFTGATKTLVFKGVANGSGVWTVTHGVPNLPLYVLSASCYTIDGGGSYVPVAAYTVGNTTFAATGVAAGAVCRMCIQYSDMPNPAG